MTDQPNFLFIITDQHRADHLGCYGNNIVQTPAIDGVAAKGARFTHFYTATPICMPNRATLMTGRMPSLHGVRMNGIPLPMSATCFTDILRAGGYETALIGKCHLQSMGGPQPVEGIPVPNENKRQPPPALAEAVKSDEPEELYHQELRKNWDNDPGHALNLPYYGFNHVDLCIGHGDQVRADYSRWLAERHDDPESLRSPNQFPGNPFEAPQAFRTKIPEELYPTTYVAEKTIEYLDNHKAGSDKPFFIQCGFPDPHHPFTPPGKYWDLYDPDDMPVPDAFDHGNHKLPAHLEWFFAEREAGTANRGSQRGFAITEREAREAIALNYGMITMVDDAIARILAHLDELGLADNTVVIFTSDHGDFMGDHQLLLKAALHYQGLIRVPFIWHDPAQPANAGNVSEEMSGTIDIGATVLDRAGLSPNVGNHGKSLTAAAAGGASGWNAVLLEEHQRRSYMGLDYNFHARSLITPRWRITLYDHFDWGEIYDLIEDPCEFDNLWDDPRTQAVKADLLEKLVRKQMQMSDSSPLATHHGP